ncbi:lipid-A-disaccharide synthase [Marinibacterium profundimaris]|uniref:Lipid-A-disaccharide synthase n=1 Tax=Marinibacterium profundimaris TaxID=1679460 RepID=A0A225NR86_9RHOB|nr:lipid-A-disaccharide synthase [Marinibacterium profundimaris]OWU77464.1 lipid-A-disaccharide synthase [Marinibacterium profundimaris]
MRVFIIAGEPSGDRLGAALMQGLKQLRPDVRFSGIGGPEMEGQGLESRFPMQELSVMGIAEILPGLRHLLRRIDETAQAVIAEMPDVLITIDSPDFCLRVAKRARRQVPVHTVHYVAPSVWAWRPKRAAKMAKMIDHVLALLPFEPPYMQAAGMDCDFVGHPVAGEPVAGAAEIAAFRAVHDLGDAPLLTVLPGSRGGEVTRHAPIFGAALAPILAERPELRLILPTTGPQAERLRALTADWAQPPLILDPRRLPAEQAQAEKRAAFAASDAALAASGTVSLELAAQGTPMAIAYGMSRVTWEIVSRMTLIDTVTLVNLITDSRVVPECLGPRCTAEHITPMLRGVLDAPERQRAATARTMELLGRGGEAPGLRAARAVLARMPGAA